MKILQISEDLPPAILGGSGRIAWEVSLALQASGHEVTILTCAKPGAFPATQNGVRISSIPPRALRWAHYRSVFSKSREREVTRIIDDIRPDLIHAHGIAWQAGYRWIAHAKRLGIPCVYTMHGVMPLSYGKVTGDERALWWMDFKRMRWEMNPLRNPLVKQALRQCDTILCVSDALRTYVERKGYAGCVTLHNGIDLSFWKAAVSRAEARKQLALSPDQPLFLLAGRIGHSKGSTAVDDVLPIDCGLLVAGAAELSAFQKSGKRVTYYPNQSPEEMRLLYAAADATLVPSIYLDPFPTMCLESMACECPVIATTFGGAKESMIDGETGWVLNPLDQTALRQRLEWCATHRRELDAMGKKARRHMETHFSLERHVSALLTIYQAARHRAGAATDRA